MARPKKQQKDTNGTRVVVYLRVSKQDNEDKNGLGVQRSAIYPYIAGKGYTVVAEIVDDGVSGAKPFHERKLLDALKLVEHGLADAVIAYNQDRFSRGKLDDLREYAQKRQIRLETADGRILTHKADEMVGDALDFVAKIERKRISDRFQLARADRSRKDGLGSGPMPYGYTRQQIDGVYVGPILVDEQAAETIRSILAYRKDHTYHQTCAYLNEQQIPAPRGGQWNVSTIYKLEQQADLYRTGTRVWHGITAAETWPTILA